MNWLMIVSLSSNIIFLLVYLKVPEFLQSFFIKRMDHDFTKKMNEVRFEQEKAINKMSVEFQWQQQAVEHDFAIRLDTFKKRVEVLPELFNQVVVTSTYYQELTSKDVLGYENIFRLEKFMLMNRFYIDNEVREKVEEIQKAIRKFMIKKFPDNDLYEPLIRFIPEESVYKKEANKINNLVTDLEKLMDKILNE